MDAEIGYIGIRTNLFISILWVKKCDFIVNDFYLLTRLSYDEVVNKKEPKIAQRQNDRKFGNFLYLKQIYLRKLWNIVHQMHLLIFLGKSADLCHIWNLISVRWLCFFISHNFMMSATVVTDIVRESESERYQSMYKNIS